MWYDSLLHPIVNKAGCSATLLRFRKAIQRRVRVFGERAFRQNLQILLVEFPGFLFVPEFLLADRQSETGDRIVVFPVERFLVAIERGAIVLALEVVVSNLYILHRLHGVPG